jgi:hypothetical protein
MNREYRGKEKKKKEVGNDRDKEGKDRRDGGSSRGD